MRSRTGRSLRGGAACLGAATHNKMASVAMSAFWAGRLFNERAKKTFRAGHSAQEKQCGLRGLLICIAESITLTHLADGLSRPDGQDSDEAVTEHCRGVRYGCHDHNLGGNFRVDSVNPVAGENKSQPASQEDVAEHQQRVRERQQEAAHTCVNKGASVRTKGGHTQVQQREHREHRGEQCGQSSLPACVERDHAVVEIVEVNPLREWRCVSYVEYDTSVCASSE